METRPPQDRPPEDSGSKPLELSTVNVVDLLRDVSRAAAESTSRAANKAADALLGSFNLTGKEEDKDKQPDSKGKSERSDKTEQRTGKPTDSPAEKAEASQRDGKNPPQDNTWQVESSNPKTGVDTLKIKSVQNVSAEQFRTDNHGADPTNPDKDQTYNYKTYQSKLDPGWKVEGVNKDGTIRMTKEMRIDVNHKADHTGLIESTKDVPKEFVKEIEDKLKQIPEGVRQTLEKAGYKVLVAPSVVEGLPELKGQTYRGWKANFEYSDGTQDAEKHLIVAPEKVKAEGNWEKVDRPEVVTHQFGHALDAVGKQLNGLYFSESKNFLEAYEKDFARMSDKDKKSEVGKYLSQANGGGHRETFASIFGLTTTGPENPGDKETLERMFPNTIEYMKKLISQLK
jgi:hypothetical protein